MQEKARNIGLFCYPNSEKILEKGNVKALRLGYDDYAKMLGCKFVAKTGHNNCGNETFTIDSVDCE